MKNSIVVVLLFLGFGFRAYSQSVPGKEENIPFLVTFGKYADKKHGDDDHSQTFFFKIPKDRKRPIYIRIFDPNVGGQHDESIAGFNSKTTFALYGGRGAYSNKASRGIHPEGARKSGTLVHSKTFSSDARYDNAWYTIGPINPAEGEDVPELGGYIFKLIAEGVSGNDGNLYRYFLSTSKTQNIAVSGGSAFTYEYTVRLHDNPREVSHIYPYINDKVVSIEQANFDWDSDGRIVIYSKVKLGVRAVVSQDGNWKTSKHNIVDKEKNACLDLQFVKNKATPAKNNNVVFYVTNQYGEYLPFYNLPIGFTPDVPIKITPE